jgi:hypothetical protein
MSYKYDVLNLAWFLASKIKKEKAELVKELLIEVKKLESEVKEKK